MKDTKKFFNRSMKVIEEVAKASGTCAYLAKADEKDEVAVQFRKKKLDEAAKSLKKITKDLNSLAMDYFIEGNIPKGFGPGDVTFLDKDGFKKEEE